MQTQQPPLQVQHLFHSLDEKLMELLQSLTPEEWQAPTIAKQWNVKDIAAHLLDGNIRALAQQKEKYFAAPSPVISSYQDLVAFINRQNADWIVAARRMSPSVLLLLHKATGKLTSDYFASVNPYDKAIFSVDWAGENESLNWMHIAREYTEKWHHQQQIRDAINKPGIMTREFYYPLIDTFMHALPYTYRNVAAAENTLLCFHVDGDIGGVWYLARKNQQWLLTKASTDAVSTEVVLDPDTAWKLFTKGISSEEAKRKAVIKGDKILAEEVFRMVSVIA